MGVEWAAPNRIVRWDAANNNWIALVGTPPLVEIAVGSPNHVFGVTATGEIYKLKRPEWTEWRLVKGKLQQISVGQDGTVGGIGTDGNTYLRNDEDVTKEISTPAYDPVWGPLEAPAVYIEVVLKSDIIVMDKCGTLAETLPLSANDTLTITNSTVTESDTRTIAPLADSTNCARQRETEPPPPIASRSSREQTWTWSWRRAKGCRWIRRWCRFPARLVRSRKSEPSANRKEGCNWGTDF